MNPIRKLVGQTAIYGLPTIVGRLLNYLLVPLYTYYLPPENYGVVSEIYALVAFLIVLLTFGMETAFFRYYNLKEDKESVFRTSFITVIGINILFFLIILFTNRQIAGVMLFEGHSEYIILFSAIVCIDAVAAVPMAKLRSENKALRFSAIHFSAIGVNILFNLFFLIYLMDPARPEEGVLFILIANLLSSLVKIAGTAKDFLNLRLNIDLGLSKEMLFYSLPLVIGGFAGIINETLDRVILKHTLFNRGGLTLTEAEWELGVYSANYKLAMLITIFLQAYRYAAEPFFFANSSNVDRRKLYGKIMNYFVAAVLFMFLLVALNVDIFKYFIRNEAYWDGLTVVPILLLANVFLGIYFNQSIWYKLSHQTKFGAYIAVGGAFLTILINVIFIPTFGYMASAWATLIVYALQMVASYLLGQKYYPIRYNLRKFFLYLGLALTIFFIFKMIDIDSGQFSWLKFVLHNLGITVFLLVIIALEKPFAKRN